MDCIQRSMFLKCRFWDVPSPERMISFKCVWNADSAMLYFCVYLFWSTSIISWRVSVMCVLSCMWVSLNYWGFRNDKLGLLFSVHFFRERKFYVHAFALWNTYTGRHLRLFWVYSICVRYLSFCPSGKIIRKDGVHHMVLWPCIFLSGDWGNREVDGESKIIKRVVCKLDCVPHDGFGVVTFHDG